MSWPGYQGEQRLLTSVRRGREDFVRATRSEQLSQSTFRKDTEGAWPDFRTTLELYKLSQYLLTNIDMLVGVWNYEST